MKNTKKILAIGLMTALFVGCAQRAEERAMKEVELAKQDSIMVAAQAEAAVSSSAAVMNKDTVRKFIRTADLKFKVKDVRSATYTIEDIVSSFDGFVTYTNLTSNIDRRMIVPASADSSLESIYYTVENNMTIRVPNVKLDSTLKAMAKLIDYLDYRLIKADDISLSLLANKMTEKRLTVHEQRLKNAIDDRGKKLNETSNAEEKLLDKQTLADNAKIENMNLVDKMSFSTITLSIYQRQSVKRELIGNDKNIEEYKPGFFHRIKEAMTEGWIVFESILLFFVQIWGILLLGVIAFFIFRKYFLKRKTF
jgi:hypothetical protein